MMKRILCVVLTVAMVFGIIAVAPVHVHATSDMQASEKLLTIIKTMEGFTAIPRWDYGQWTVGFGTRCPDEHLERYKAEGIPLDEADALFREHFVYFEKEVNSFMKRYNISLNQGQFDSLVSMSYNLGAAFLYNSESTATKAVLSGATGNELIFAFSVACTAGGEFLPGLMRRRLVEAAMYLQGYYGDQQPENYCYVLYDANGGKRDVSAQGYDCNLAAVPMSQPTYEGYTFAGWYTSPTGGVKVNSLDESTNGMTLYAHWTKGSIDSGITIEPVDGIRIKVTGDSVNIRSGPGTNYSIVGGVVRGNELVITGVTKIGSSLWGQFDRGWICLDYTNYEEVISALNPGGKPDTPVEDPNDQLPIDATVLASGGITVYNGPHTSYPKRGTLQAGTQIQILEFMEFLGVRWARFSGGWVQVNSKLFIHDDTRLAHSFTTIVTYPSLNVRSAPGMSNSIVGTVKKGNVLEVIAVTMVDGSPWGRISNGWISLSTEYTDFDINKLPSYQNHIYGSWNTTKDATCIDHGEERRNCTMCDHYETRQTELVAHRMGSWYESLEGTCVSVGQERRDCNICDYHETRETALGEHSYGDWYETQAPTCSEVGQQRCDCTLCDAYLTDEVPMTEHDFDVWYETKTPTAEEPGEERRNCKNCSYFEIRELEPTEHIFGEWFISVESTCVQQGQERRNCSHCDLFETRALELADHSLGSWDVYQAPTCTESGELRRPCLYCDYYENRVMQSNGHVLGEWMPYKDATCTEMGEERCSCADCDYYESRPIDTLAHKLGDWMSHLGATCTEDGEQRRCCADCDYFESSVIPATGHSFDQWYTHLAPTITSQGEERRECLHCDHYESRILDKLAQAITKVYATMTNASYTYLNVRSGAGSGYSVIGRIKYGTTVELLEQKTVNGDVWGRTTVGWVLVTGFLTVETVTVEAKDFTTRYFANVVCNSLNLRTGPGSNYPVLDLLPTGEVVEVLELRTIGSQQWARLQRGWILLTDLAALSTYVYSADPNHSHVYGNWSIHKDATCTENGEERRQCTECDHFESRVIEATGHSFGNWYTYKDATEFENGEERRDCADCDHYESRVIQATGHTHTFGDWYIQQDATCTEDGQQRRDCTGCDHYESRAIEATGHSFGDWYVHLEATETAEGEERRECADCDHYESRVIPVKEPATITKVYGTMTNGNYANLNIRSGAGSGYSIVGKVKYGATVEILEQKTVDGSVWGRIEGGWVLITGFLTLKTVEQAPPSDSTVTKVYGTMTNGNYANLNIRSGAGSGYSIVGKVPYGATVEILEQKTVDGSVWGRIEGGWVLITGFLTLKTVEETVPVDTEPKTYGTMTNGNYANLNIRSGAGSGYGIVGKVKYGATVEILEQKTVDGSVWGRIEGGWVLITGFLTLKSM